MLFEKSEALTMYIGIFVELLSVWGSGAEGRGGWVDGGIEGGEWIEGKGIGWSR